MKADDAASLAHAVHTGTSIGRYTTPGYAVIESVYLAGHRTRPHAHESPFVFITLAGDGIDCIDGDDAEARAGRAGFIPAGCPHSHDITSTTRALTIDIRPEFVAGLSEGGVDLRKQFTLASPETLHLAAQLRGEIQNPDPLSRLQVEALITTMTVSLLRSHRRSDTTSTPRWLQHLASELAERYKEDFSLDDLAAELGRHPVYVSQAFRRYYGETLGDYVRRLRVKEGRRLLEAGSDPIAQIAVEVGYHDESHFSKVFKNVVGTTPGRYRRIVRSH